MIYKKIIINKKKGALLLELLIVISLIAVIFAVGTQAILISLRSDKVSSERDIAFNLASEALGIVRSVAEEDWHNIYVDKDLSNNSEIFFPLKVGNTWTIKMGTETVVLNGINYVRSFVFKNVSRDATLIEQVYNSAKDDPSTQKINVTVSWPEGNIQDSVIISGYIFRWKNSLCIQSEWTTQISSDESSFTCPASTYFSSSNLDTSVTGSLSLTGTTPKEVEGSLVSSIFDSGVLGGVGFNSIKWKGLLGGVGLNEGKVKLQLAASNCSNLASDYPTCTNDIGGVYFGGQNCNVGEMFDMSVLGESADLRSSSCLNTLNNKRYFRYKLWICSNDCVTAGNNTPVVDDIIINWAP
jgi:type II secretory pathway pseudopilin PulG